MPNIDIGTPLTSSDIQGTSHVVCIHCSKRLYEGTTWIQYVIEKSSTMLHLGFFCNSECYMFWKLAQK